MKAALAVSAVCWAPPGIRPHVPCQFVREYVYVYSAVAPAQGKMTSLILPTADSAMMTLFLEHVSLTFSKYFIVMQVDRASCHHSDELAITANIRLIEQPAYSPEVNPVEHLWDDVREKYLGNRAFPSLDAWIEVLCQGLNELADDPERLRSLTGFPPIVNVHL
jgi:hypothetical protein